MKGGQYHREEGCYGAFQRAFRMPAIIDQTKLQGMYKNGVLALRLPKRDEARPLLAAGWAAGTAAQG